MKSEMQKAAVWAVVFSFVALSYVAVAHIGYAHGYDAGWQAVTIESNER